MERHQHHEAMSMTKNSAAFDAAMEERRLLDDLSHDEYLSEQYFRNRTKARYPVDDEQPEGQLTNDPKGDE
jgi:hypothetical protein